MTKSSARTQTKKGLTPLGVIGFIAGLALFAYFVEKAGVGQILEGIRRLGAGFVLVIAVSALRQIARSIAWTLCMSRGSIFISTKVKTIVGTWRQNPRARFP